MRKFIAGLLAVMAIVNTAGATAAPAPSQPYLNPSLAPEARAADLVHRMTLEEKASQLVNHARAIPRLGVPAYDWWSEALHGVLTKGTTVFPEPVGLAATFDPDGIHQMAEAVGVEGRIKHDEAMKKGHSTTFEGLDFWAPNINIFRDPRWGRGQETYGEDPFLTGRIAVAYVTGLQGSDPRYYRAISTPKHYAVHSGPEPTRHFADVDVSKHDMEDTYLPAFRAAVTEGRAGSVMCAYNAVNGEPACASQFLLQHTLRGAWKFGGYVVSDCSAVKDIFEGHHYRASQPEASAISLMRGMDNECITFGEVTGKDDYQPYIDAVRKGYLPQSAVDRALVRLFTARMRLGMFDPPAMVPYTRIDKSELDSPAHRQLALRLAEESMVLLKNDGVLPLKGAKRIAIVGPLADQTPVLLGNYHGEPTHAVSVLEGMKAAFPDAQITYVPGTQFLSNKGDLVPVTALKTDDGQPGLKAEYRSGENFDPKAPAVASRIEPGANVEVNAPPAAVQGKPFNVHWTGVIRLPETGDYRIGITADNNARVMVGGQPIALTYGGTSLGRVHLEKNVPVKIDASYASKSGTDPHALLIWHRVNDAPDSAAATAAKNADVVVAVVGLTSALEGEEMPVSEPGFQGGDRTSIDLPEPEEALVRAVASAGKPLVVVLMNGSALAARWEKEHANAILEAWYPGEEGGAAIANTLSGRNNPGGRLPVTFYQDAHQLPNFENYAMNGRTYRYFAGTPLWPFGYGLSYTHFSYGPLAVKPSGAGAVRRVHIETEVRNSGTVAGDEVAQLYLNFPDNPGVPRIALRGLQRLSLKPGETRKIAFDLTSRDLSAVTPEGERRVLKGAYRVSVGSGQPGTGVPVEVRGIHDRSAIDLARMNVPRTPAVLVTRRLPETVETRLSGQFRTALNKSDEPPGRDVLQAAMQEHDALLTTITDRIDAALIATESRRVRIIANFGTGTDHIDVDAAKRAGIIVTNTPDALTEATAELTILLMLMAARRAGEGERVLRAGEWKGWGPTHMIGQGLTGRTLGLVGFGRIARRTAAKARGLGMSVRYFSRSRAPSEIETELGATPTESLAGLAAEADILSLHVPGGSATHHLIDRRILARMKPTAILVNTARGSVVDEAALAEALAAGQIAAAGLDVYEREPEVEPMLLSLENVVLLPHLGSATIEARTAMGMQAADNLGDYFAGREPRNRVP